MSGGQAFNGEEAGSGFVVTGGYSAILLAFGEEILNQMAGLAEVFVVIALNLPVRFGLDDGGLSGLRKRRVLSSKPVGGKWPDAIAVGREEQAMADVHGE